MIQPRFALLAAALLAACGSEPSTDAPRGSAPDSASPVPAAAAAADSTPGTTAASAAPAIVLAPDGLSVTGGAAPKQLAFGSPRAAVLAEVGGILGKPAEQGTQEECPSGPLYYATYGAGLQLQFQDSAFVGWFAREGSAFRTAAGIGPGSTLAQLKAAYPATTVEETSLGHEFAAGELFGVLTAPSDAGVVEVIFAGINCIFR